MTEALRVAQDAAALVVREVALRRALVLAGRSLDGRGWVMGTSGNLSARLAGEAFLITASGKHKGRLAEADFVVVPEGRGGPDGDGSAPAATGGLRPSAETCLHEVLYAALDGVGAIVHTHAPASTVVSLRAPALAPSAWVDLPPVEMVKGLGIWDADAPVPMLVLPNHGDVPRIAADLAIALGRAPLRVPGFLIRGHGATVWGASVEEAVHRMESLELICEISLKERA